MALGTGGTSASTSLNSLIINKGDPSPGNVGAFAKLILNDQNPNAKAGTWPTSFAYPGMLWVPNRGYLHCLPGDIVMVDTTTGWPILVSKRAAASGPWVHNP